MHKTALSFSLPSIVKSVSLLALGCLFAPGAVAEMYKWVDEDGQVQYTQSPPPPGVEGETIKPPPPPASPEEAQKQMQAREELLDGLQEDRQNKVETDAQAAAGAAWTEENCRRARASVSAYQVPNALIAQPDGSRTRITEEQRLAGLKEAQERVKEYCK